MGETKRDKYGRFIKGNLSRKGEHFVSYKKGRTLEDIYGKEKSETLKQNHSRAMWLKARNGELKIPNMKGFKHSKKTKDYMSKCSKERWKTENYKKKYSNSKKLLYRNNLEYSKKMSIQSKKAYNNLEIREKMIQNNKKLFKNTSIEIKIQNFLKELNIEFYTHQFIKIFNAYQCDIFVPSLNLIIECDGDYWHGNSQKFPILKDWQINQKEQDKVRTDELIKKGYNVLRLWGSEIEELNCGQFLNKLAGLKNYT